VKVGDVPLDSTPDLAGSRVGNALDPADFVTLMAEELAAMVFTDPPYNVPIDRHASGLGAIHHRPFPMASGEMAKTEFTAFLSQAFHNLAAFSADGSQWRHGVIVPQPPRARLCL
jgi:hypothetical protein